MTRLPYTLQVAMTSPALYSIGLTTGETFTFESCDIGEDDEFIRLSGISQYVEYSGWSKMSGYPHGIEVRVASIVWARVRMTS